MSSWVTPAYTRGQVDRAGTLLVTNWEGVSLFDVTGMFDTINNWRARATAG